MPMLDALRAHCEATGDPRVQAFMLRYFGHQLAELPARPLEAWGRPRGGDNIDTALWLYNRTGEPFLLSLADLLHEQTSDWIGELTADGPSSDAFEFGHGVNRAMGFKEPAVYYQRSRDPAHLAALRTGWERTMQHHGQIQGLYSGDEFLHGRGSTQGTELCTIVELLSSFQTALAIGGGLWLADAIERIAYNALPAILSADHCGHQYFELPNQVECTPGERNFNVHYGNDLLFGPVTGYGCCAANLHMGWPRLVQHLWMAARDGGLAALVLAPCEVTATIGGQRVRVVEETTYPFGDEVQFSVRAPEPVHFPLSVRIPEWAAEASIEVNGTPVEMAGRSVSDASRLVTVSRQWRDGDVMTVTLPMAPRLSRWDGGAVGVERGPLVYALRVGEDWRKVGGAEPFADYEVHPTTPWNYGLRLDAAATERAFRLRHRALARQPWSQDGSSVFLEATGQRIPEWTLTGGVSGPIPVSASPVTPPETVTLVPFGCARLRISMFPVVR